jgi:hypothetical protein
MPHDASVIAHEAGYVSADALVEHRLPRHRSEAKSVFDHGEAPLARLVESASMPRAFAISRPTAPDLLALQYGDKVPRQEEGSVSLAFGVAGLDEPLGAPVEGPGYVAAENVLDERYASVGNKLPVEPGRSVAADLLFKVEGRRRADPQAVANLAEVIGMPRSTMSLGTRQ